MRVRWLVIVGLFVAAVLWLWQSTREASQDSAGSTAAAQPARDSSPRPSRSALVQTPSTRLVLPPRQGTFDASSSHTADPCTAIVDPIIPPTFETITAANITIAWDPADANGPYDTPLRPTALAFAVAGVLEEAAQLTGTDRRQSLTVIIDASPEALQSRTGIPSWVGGFYDGGAVHVPAKPNADFGVAMTTLRHEVMHAQMHAAIGCTPFWFNEGLASYFAGTTPVREWLAMMRSGDAFDITMLRRPAILDLKEENVHRMYSVSLAMVLYLVHRAGDTGLLEAVRAAQSADSIPAALDLWNRVQPNADYRAVTEMLAQKVFGMPLGSELDAILQGPLCCTNMRSPAQLSCRVQPATEPSRREVCRKRW